MAVVIAASARVSAPPVLKDSGYWSQSRYSIWIWAAASGVPSVDEVPDLEDRDDEVAEEVDTAEGVRVERRLGRLARNAVPGGGRDQVDALAVAGSQSGQSRRGGRESLRGVALERRADRRHQPVDLGRQFLVAEGDELPGHRVVGDELRPVRRGGGGVRRGARRLRSGVGQPVDGEPGPDGCPG